MQSTCVCNTYKMEYDKINNLLGSESENLSKFVTREYVRINSVSNTYNENKSIRFKTPMLSKMRFMRLRLRLLRVQII